jgi:hypothetical protein
MDELVKINKRTKNNYGTVVYCGKLNLWTDKRVVFPLVELELPIKSNWTSNLHRAIQNKWTFGTHKSELPERSFDKLLDRSELHMHAWTS